VGVPDGQANPADLALLGGVSVVHKALDSGLSGAVCVEDLLGMANIDVVGAAVSQALATYHDSLQSARKRRHSQARWCACAHATFVDTEHILSDAEAATSD